MTELFLVLGYLAGATISGSIYAYWCAREGQREPDGLILPFTVIWPLAWLLYGPYRVGCFAWNLGKLARIRDENLKLEVAARARLIEKHLPEVDSFLGTVDKD